MEIAVEIMGLIGTLVGLARDALKANDPKELRAVRDILRSSATSLVLTAGEAEAARLANGEG